MPARLPRSTTTDRVPAPSTGRLPLVGRAAELHTLLNALTDADAKRGGALFVVGESGVGKTRLVAALAEQAAQRGFAVAVGRGYPVETGVPYAVFSDALLPLLRTVDRTALTLLTRGGMAELVQLFPALAGASEAPVVAPRGDPAEVKARLLWNFSQFLSRYSAKRPLLVVLENLQWADGASLEMLHFVARQVGGDRLLVVCTHNDPELRTNPALRAT
ncbi:MAG: BREX system ATP-binding domain-containing protein, partial [Gemmatimonadales bacterium]